MKKLSVLVVMMAFVTATFANVNVGENTEFKVLKMAESGKYKLVYVSEMQSPVSIKIFAEDGELISVDQIKNKDAFTKTYDFANMEEGNYTFEVRNKEGAGSEVISHLRVKQFNLMVSSMEENKFKVMVAGFDPAKTVTIKIYNEDGTLLKKDVVKAHRDFARVYDTSNINTSKLTFVACSGSSSMLQTKEIQ